MNPNYRSSDTGAQLRSLYAPQGGVGQIFANKVSDYVFSRSYMPVRTSEQGQQACRQVRAVFQRLAVGGRVAVRYTTVAILGRPQ